MQNNPVRVSRWLILGTIAFALTVCIHASQQPPRYVERVDVARVIIDVRVLEDDGAPVLGLTADDFKVKIDGKTVAVESATWVGGGRVRSSDRAIGSSSDGRSVLEPAAAPLPSRALPTNFSESTGRLIVFLFQKSLEHARIVGLMRMLRQSRDFLQTLSPDDRIAVLSFDSHLKIWTDFTNDRARLEPLLRRGVLLERPPAVQASSPMSLVERLTPAKGRGAYGIEEALQLIAEALQPLPGSKSIVLFGHGMGRLGFNGVTMENAYETALNALLESRTSVFALDVTDADYHSLEVGLQLISQQTGGFYAKTHIFPDLAMQHLGGALEGYYVLIVEKPETTRTTHDLDVKLTRRKGQVLARSSFAGS